MKQLITLSLIFALSSQVFAQPSIQWQRCLGGGASDLAQAIQQTTDGGYIICGFSNSVSGEVTGNHGGYDYWVVKTDSIGNILWENSFGGKTNQYAYSVQQTIDGGYVVAGYSEYNGNDFWVLKLDKNGNLQWQKFIGGTGSEIAYSIEQTTDKGYIVAGSSNSALTGQHGDDDYYIVKLDSSGNTQWSKLYGGSALDVATSVEQTNDGGFIVAGYSRSSDGDVTGHHGSNGEDDYWIVKLGSSGKIKWEKSFGGTNEDQPFSIKQISDNGYIISGQSYSDDGDVTGHHFGTSEDFDVWVVRIDHLGNLRWEKSLGGSANDGGNSVIQTSDGGFFIAGITDSEDGDVTGNHGNGDTWVVKLDRNGNIKWQEALGGSSAETAYSTQQTKDGGYIIANYSSSNDGDVSGNHGSNDYWIVKLNPEMSPVSEERTIIEKNSLINSISLYPNPSTDFVTVSYQFSGNILTLSDLTGRELEVLKVESGNSANLNTSFLSPGIYFVSVRNKEGSLITSEKLVKE